MKAEKESGGREEIPTHPLGDSDLRAPVALCPCDVRLWHGGLLLRHESRDPGGFELVRTAEDHRRMIEQFLDERVGNLSFVACTFGMDGLRREGCSTRSSVISRRVRRPSSTWGSSMTRAITSPI